MSGSVLVTPPRAQTAKNVELRRVSLPRLIFGLLHQRFTGLLQLEQPQPYEGGRTIWFTGGMPVFTDWVDPEATLGEMLLNDGTITEEQHQDALEDMSSSGQLLGRILLQKGLLDEVRLGASLARQCRRKLLPLFDLQSGTATLLASEHERQGMTHQVNALELILAGVTAYYDETRIVAEVGDVLHGPCRVTGAFSRYRTHFSFRTTDVHALDAMATCTSVEALTQLGIMPLRAKQLFYTLWVCQMLRVGSAAETPSVLQQARPPKVPNPSADTSRPTGTDGAPSASIPPKPPASVFAPPRSDATPAGGTPPLRASPPPIPPSSPRVSPPPGVRPLAAEAATTGDASPLNLPPPLPRPTSSKPAADPEVPPPIRSAKPAPEAEPARQAPTANPIAEAAFIAEITELEAAIEKQANAFALLGLPLDAERPEIRKAWGDLSRRLHPDALQGRGLGHLRDRVGRIFAALSEAESLLSDKDQRKVLREKLERGADPNEDQNAVNVARAAFESDIIARDADKFLKANRFDRALEHYERALALTPDESDLIAAVAWCRFNLSNRSRDDAAKAERELARVVAETPKLARAHYFRGMVLRDMGSSEAAVAAFDIARKHDPRLIDAERQARAIRAARSKGPSSPATASKTKARGIRGLFSKD